MILCGWCGRPTVDTDRCTSCGHSGPERPYIQRGETAPAVRTDAAGRRALDPKAIRRRLDEARSSLGAQATVEQIAERLDVSPRTVRRWQQMS